MRRELRVWSSVDVEFLTTYVLSLLKAIDIRSEPAVRLLREFLDPSGEHGPRNGLEFPNGTEHFAHELYSFLRSPYKELWRWDEVSQVGREVMIVLEEGLMVVRCGADGRGNADTRPVGGGP